MIVVFTIGSFEYSKSVFTSRTENIVKFKAIDIFFKLFGKTGGNWDSAPEVTGTLLTMWQS